MAKRPLSVSTPGEEPTDTSQPTDAASPEVAAAESPAAAPASGIPNEREIDPATIPYGKTVLTRQGHVCSTAPDPKRK